jgi:hypothetical protein
MAKTHGQHVLETIADNLYKLPGIICPRHSKNREMVLKRTPSSHNMGEIRKLNTHKPPQQEQQNT